MEYPDSDKREALRRHTFFEDTDSLESGQGITASIQEHYPELCAYIRFQQMPVYGVNSDYCPFCESKHYGYSHIIDNGNPVPICKYCSADIERFLHTSETPRKIMGKLNYKRYDSEEQAYKDKFVDEHTELYEDSNRNRAYSMLYDFVHRNMDPIDIEDYVDRDLCPFCDEPHFHFVSYHALGGRFLPHGDIFVCSECATEHRNLIKESSVPNMNVNLQKILKKTKIASDTEQDEHFFHIDDLRTAMIYKDKDDLMYHGTVIETDPSKGLNMPIVNTRSYEESKEGFDLISEVLFFMIVKVLELNQQKEDD